MNRLTLAPTVLIIVFLAKLAFPLFDDPDFYWHIKTGEYLLAQWPLQTADMFAFTTSNQPGVIAEWLSQIIYYLVFKTGSFQGVSLFVACFLTLTWYINYKSCLKLLAKDEAKAILTTLLFCGLFGGVAPRPHLFTFFLFAALLHVLIKVKYFKNDKALWLIPPMMVLWANLHGGFFIGLVLLGAFIFCEGVRYYLKSADHLDGRKLIRVCVFSLLGFLVTALNPSLFDYWLYPYQAIVSSGDMATINEWQSPNFHDHFFQYYLGVVLVFFASMIYSKRKPDLTEIVIPLIFICGAFIAVRNIPLAALAMAPFFTLFYRDLTASSSGLGNDTGQSATVTRDSSESTRLEVLNRNAQQQLGSKEATLNWLLLGFSVLGLVVIYPSHHQKMVAAIETMLPIKATDFIVENGIRGRMFNAYHYGGYLIYRLYPEQKVFIYGRTEIYPIGFISEFNSVYQGEPKWQERFDKHNIDYVICESHVPLRQLLLATNQFRLVFDDTHHSVLLKNTEKYHGLIARYGK